jgi:hypothetical protein
LGLRQTNRSGAPAAADLFEDRRVTAYTLVAVKPKLKDADPAGRTGCKQAVHRDSPMSTPIRADSDRSQHHNGSVCRSTTDSRRALHPLSRIGRNGHRGSLGLQFHL